MELNKSGQLPEEQNPMKYSAMLIDLAKPYLGLYPTIDEYEELMAIVVQAWNIATFKNFIPEMYLPMLEQAKTHLGERKLKKLLDNLIKDKLRKYNKQDTYIGEYEFVEKGEGESDFLLTVKSMPIKDFLIYLNEQKEKHASPQIIDREIVIVHCKQPFLDWLKTIDPGYNDTQAYEPGTFLIGESFNEEEVIGMVKEKFAIMFELMLKGISWDETQWPENRTYEMFLEWFEIEVSGITYDLEDYPVSKG